LNSAPETVRIESVGGEWVFNTTDPSFIEEIRLTEAFEKKEGVSLAEAKKQAANLGTADAYIHAGSLRFYAIMPAILVASPENRDYTSLSLPDFKRLFMDYFAQIGKAVEDKKKASEPKSSDSDE